MGEKKLADYKKLYRQKYPNLSDKQITDLAKAALAKDTQNASADDSVPSFGDTVSDSPSTRGVRVGFGLTDKDGNDLYVVPTQFPAFMTRLSVKNPKAYNAILTNVYKATGTKYRDPNTLGTWLEGMGRNLQASVRQDPTAASLSMENLVNAGIVNRGAAGIFAKAPTENLPTRQIYNVRKEDIEADINDIAFKTLGREIVDADKNSEWYKNLVNGVSELYSKGTVTSTKQAVNPRTGKKENVVVQSPKFSKEQITEKITTAVTTADPEALARKQNLDFANWAFKKMGGQG